MSCSLSHVPLFPSGRPLADEWYGREGFVGILHLVGSDEPCREVSPDAQRRSAKALEALDQVEAYLREKDFSLFQQYCEVAPDLGGHLIALQDSLKPLRRAFEDHSLFQSITESTPTTDFLYWLNQLATVQRDLAPIRAVQEDIQAVIQAIDKQLPTQDQERWVQRVISALSVISILLSYLGVPNTFCIPLSIILGGTIREERNNLLRQQQQKCEAFLRTLNHLEQHSPTQEKNMNPTEKLAQLTVQGFADLCNLIIERTGGSAPAQHVPENATAVQPTLPTETQPKALEKPTHQASGSQTLPDVV